MHSRPFRLTVALALVLVGLRWVVNTNAWSGPTILRFTEAHGVHLNDWVSLACWAVAAALVWPHVVLARVPHVAVRRTVEQRRPVR